MTEIEQKKAAKKFVENWAGKGYEKGESQKFWLDLLCNVYGIQDFSTFVYFENQIKDKFHDKTITNFIDAYIPSTKVMIEQKSSGKDLRKAIKQSDGTFLTPFQQAKKYIAGLPLSQHPRWVITCNFEEFLVYDMEQPNGEPESILLENLEKEYYRLSFLTEQENIHLKREMEISIKAGDIVGLIYDKLLAQYQLAKNVDMEKCLKSLNMLCVRLVFCLYAEDAGIFGHKSMFGDYLNHFEAKDLRSALINLFKVLDQKPEERDPFLEEELTAFPYVNGGLFTEEDQFIPPFTDEIKDLLVRKASDDFNWAEISPTIFGAVFESTLNPETRRSGGMHYTSIENIHKVIDPLFMDELEAEFDSICATTNAKAKNDKLHAFQEKLGSLKFLDPACGSGNFLTEAYLSLRRLENEVITILNKGEKVLGFDEFIKVKINQFYGIEINDFAVTVAQTALWIAESQMMKETENIIGINLDFLPLTTNAFIVQGNALRMDWETFEVLPEGKNVIYADKTNIYKIDFDNENPMIISEPTVKYGEVNIVTKEVEFKNPEELQTPKTISVTYDYIMGNPPFVGARFMDKRQKEDVLLTFGKDWAGVGDLDYVCCWYKKATDLMQKKSTRGAFVSTNSITQGSSVCNLWKPLFENGLHFDFAYQTFKWLNETLDKKNMAAVHCVIIGFSVAKNDKPKIIFNSEGNKSIVKNINGYLEDSPSVFIEKRSNPLCDVSPLLTGSQRIDDDKFMFTNEEKEDFLKKEPSAEKYFRIWYGADEFLYNRPRWCLYLGNCSPAELRKMKHCAKIVEEVKEYRLASKRSATVKAALTPWRFGLEVIPTSNFLLIPVVSSEKRRYVPIGFMTPDNLCSNQVNLIPDATLYEFGVLTSSVHMTWMRTVAGRLESRYRYSKDIVYNNFPWCNPTDEQKAKIEQTAQAILDARAKYPESSLADLYDETVMPPELRKAHQENDKAVMQAYGFSIKMTESECVAELFKLYSQLVQACR